MSSQQHDVMTCTGAEAIVAHLDEAGVEYVFGMSGHANLSLLDALSRSRIHFVTTPHEQLAVHAADAYYRASHRLGVVLTTLGPGISNTVSGLADAVQDCSSLLVLAGNVPVSNSGREAYQEIGVRGLGQVDMLRAVTKRAWRVEHPDQVIPFLGYAFNAALSAPAGPVLLDLPMDLMSYVQPYPHTRLRYRRTDRQPAADPSAILEAAAVLRSAKRPVIYCGGGVLQSEGAPAAVERLAQLLNAPVVTTLIAQSVMNNEHELFGGVTGAVGCRPAHFCAANADVLLIVGSRLSDMDANSLDSGYFSPPPYAKIVQIDVDPMQIGKHFETPVGIVADAGLALTALADELDGFVSCADPYWLAAVRETKAEWRAELMEAQACATSPLLPEHLLAIINSELPADGCIVAGIGPRYFVSQHYVARRIGAHFTASGTGTMGFAVPAALGVKLARPAAPVICFCGDGEMKSVSPALAIAAEQRIPVVWVILNNYSYNVIELYQNKYFGALNGSVFETPDGELYSPDYAAMARSYGLNGHRVTTSAEFRSALRLAVSATEATVLDVIVTRRPKLRASGYWDANRYLVKGWNLPDTTRQIGGFGDAASSVPLRREWDQVPESVR